MGAPKGAEQIKWFNTWARAAASGCAFNFFIGGRGIGKTYSGLLGHKEAYLSGSCGRLIYMRIQGSELDGASTSDDNPYKKINYKTGSDIEFISAGKAHGYRICDLVRDAETGKVISENQIGVGRSLASFHNLRGVDFYDYTHIYFDEFIPREGVRRTPEIKQAGSFFSEAYETINRNRELEGEPPVICIFTANAFSLDSSILQFFGLVKTIQHMQERGQKRFTDRERSIYVELCDSRQIADLKADTVLYRAAANNAKFKAVNLENRFTDRALSAVVQVPINEYVPIVQYENITIFEHKSTRRLHAASYVDLCGQKYYTNTKQKFLRRYYQLLKVAMMENVITFDSADTYYELEHLLDKSSR